MTKISLITIGTELLKGRIVNTNATEVGLLLRKHGYDLHRNLSIPDTGEAIRSAVQEELSKSDVVLMSGGLGPTKDDITKNVLLQLYATKLVPDPDTLSRLEKYFEMRGRPFTDLNRQQADIPNTCTAIPNYNGTAPGMWFNFGKNMLFSMPGVPFEMLAMLENEIVPRLKEAFNGRYFHHRILRLANIPEASAAERMEQIEETWPKAIDVAYLPRRDGLWIELSDSGPITESVEGKAIIESAFSEMETLFHDKAYTAGEMPVPEILGNLLKAKGLTFGVAESLTGGMVAAKVVSVSGSSTYFKGGVTAYDPGIKVSLLGVPQALIDQHTVVSEEVAIAMAQGARRVLGADIAVSTTGIAERDPVTGELPYAWIGFARKSQAVAIRVVLYGDRNVARERASYHALLLAIGELKKMENGK